MVKDEHRSQRERIERIVRGSFPAAEPRFDETSPNVKFVLRKKGSDLLLTDIVHWQPGEAAKMTDGEIIDHLKAMGGGKL